MSFWTREYDTNDELPMSLIANQIFDRDKVGKELSRIDTCFSEYLDIAGKFIRQPSISLTGEGIAEMASLLTGELRSIGAEIIDSAPRFDPPVIHARLDYGAPVTVLLYGMYDVMPAEEPEWIVPPFAGEVHTMRGVGDCLLGRGAENSKGPLAGIIYTIRSMLLSSESLPVNLEIVIEGQEEKGSRNLRDYLIQNASLLRYCDVALFPEFCEYDDNPRIYLGFKGIVHGRMDISGGDWGGAVAPTHSSNLPWIDSPLLRLLAALNQLASPRGDYFIQGSENLFSCEDDQLIEVLAYSLDIKKELRSRNVLHPQVQLDPVDMLKRLLLTTSLNISRLASGLDQAASSIPVQASARFDLRLPPGISPEETITSLRAHLERAKLRGIKVLIDDAYPGSKFSLNNAGVQALLTSYRTLGYRPQIWPFCPGSAPAYAFENIGTPLILGGLGSGGNAHGANEFATLDGMKRFAQSLCLWLHSCAAGQIRQP